MISLHVVVSIVGAAAGVILLLVLPRRRSMATVVGVHPTEVPPLNVVGGGVWTEAWWPMSATWPLVRLEGFSWGIRIGPSTQALHWLIPTTEIAWQDIERARRLRMGIAFRRKSSSWGSVRFTNSGGVPPALVSALRYYHVPYDE
jgi:hypothetical protein